MRSFKVVVVDDDEDDYIFLKAVLEDLYGDAVQLVYIRSEKEFNEKCLEQKQETPDLFILDYSMPPVTAINLLKNMRQHAHLANTKTLVCSDTLTEDGINACLEAGASGYIPKVSGYAATKERLKELIGDLAHQGE